VLIIAAFVLLLFVPSPWNLVAFLITVALGIVELLAWNRTVRHRKKAVGAQIPDRQKCRRRFALPP
jgi:membrane protein implicated in regulation of membrane protease activity